MHYSIQRRLLARMLLTITAVIGIGAYAAPTEDIVYYHNDILGNPLAATDESGNVIWQESYTAYGEKTIEEEAGDNNPLAFTGHYQDRESGLVYMGARYYSPELGRFLSPDPADFAGQVENNPIFFNRYVYAHNNPYTYMDPDGRYATLVLGGIFGAITLYETYQTYQNEGAGAALTTLGIGAAMSASGLGALKVASKGLKWAKTKIKAGSGPKGNSPPVDVPKKAGELTEPPVQQVDPKNLIPTQTRNEISGSQVKRLKKDMQKNGFDQSEPVDVVRNSRGRLEIEDGHHRTEAAKQAGLDKIPVRVWGE